MKRLLMWLVVVLMTIAGAATVKGEEAVTAPTQAPVPQAPAPAVTPAPAPAPAVTPTPAPAPAKAAAPAKAKAKAKPKAVQKKAAKKPVSKAPVPQAPAPQPEKLIQEVPLQQAPVKPVAEVPPPAEPNFGYKGGFYVQTADGAWKLVSKGRVQFLYTFQKKQNAAATSTFSVRRARLGFSGALATKGNFDITMEYSTQDAQYSDMGIYNATAGYEFAPEFAVTFGTVGMPLSILGTRSSLGFILIDPPLVVSIRDGGSGALTPIRNAFGNPDGLGIQFNGSISKFSYVLAVVNGAAAPSPAVYGTDASGNPVEIKPASGGVESNVDLNFRKRVSAGAQLSYNIFDAVGGFEGDFPYSENPKWTVNTGANYQGKRTDPANNVNVNYILTGTLGTSFQWRGFAVNAEAFGRKTKLIEPVPVPFYSQTMDDFGYYIDSSYFVIPNKLELGLSGSQVFREGPHNNSYQLGGAVNWWIYKQNLKWQTAYTYTSQYLDVTNTKDTKVQAIKTSFIASF